MNIGLEVLKQNSFEKSKQYPVEPEYIDRMFDYYNNMITIKESIQKYGYSTEGILETIGNAIKAFFAWLREMFRRFIAIVGQLLIAIPANISIIKQLLSMNKKITIKFNENELESVAKRYGNLIQMKTNLGSEPIDTLHKFLTSFDDDMDNKVFNAQEKVVNYSDLITILSDLSMLNAISRSGVQNMTDALKEIEQALSEHEKEILNVKTEEEQLNKTLSFNEYVTKKLNSLGFNERHLKIESTASSVKEAMDQIKYKIKLLNEYIRVVVFCGKKLGTITSDLLYACGKESCKVCVSAPIPDFLLKHLREHYQYPGFKLSTVFMTNDIILTGSNLGIPGIRPDIDISDYLGGVTFGINELTNKAEQSITCVHVTHGMIKGIFKPLTTGSFKQSTAFLTILVHEARHAYQMQTNKHFDGYAGGYSNSAEERDANKYQYRFVPTAQEQRWAEGILAEYDKEVKKAEQNAAKLRAK